MSKEKKIAKYIVVDGYEVSIKEGDNEFSRINQAMTLEEATEKAKESLDEYRYGTSRYIAQVVQKVSNEDPEPRPITVEGIE